MSAPGLPARRAAADCLAAILLEQKMLSEVAGGSDDRLSHLKGSERARAQSIALTVLRHLDRLDTVLQQFLQKQPPFRVLLALRIMASEILIDGIPPHAAVDGAVRLVRAQRKTQHLSGLTNAVSRRVAEHGPAIWPDLEPQPLPGWIEAAVAAAFGPEVPAALAKAHEQSPPTDLTLKDPSLADDLFQSLSATRLPTGSLRLAQQGQISRLDGYDRGDWWVQDAAAALPAQLLGDVSGKRVLDLCAAPGGKTLQLAAGGADVTALDISDDRLRRVRQNLTRTGLAANLVAADALTWSPAAPFDAILLDAPCSASGTLRRHPDLPYARPDPNLKPLLQIQRELLARAFDWLSDDGQLVYCTCSLLPAEGETQVESFLSDRSDARLVDWSQPDGWDAIWKTDQGFLRTRPDYWSETGGMDGFFAALIARA